jgi:hypothetical protein
MKTRRASVAAVLMRRKLPEQFCAQIALRWRVAVARVMAATAGNDLQPNRKFLKILFSRLAIFLFTGRFSGN